MKQRRKLIVPVLVWLIWVYLCACHKDSATPWASSQFAGNFMGSETCILNGTGPDTLHIVATGANQVSITNLYGLPAAVNAHVSNDSCIIQPQVNSQYVVQGLLIVSNDTITLSVIASSFGRRDECTAILLKQ